MADWRRAAGFGIYIHWPFCAAKCPYCDFNSHVAAKVEHDLWRHAYLREIDRAAERLDDPIVSTIYFGGGTPSLMEPATVSAIIDRIQARFRMVNNPEITLEANPGSVETEKFRAFRSAGVNRVSLGVQALNDSDLKRLGRIHSAKEAKQALTTALETFSRVNFDLIYGRQDQSLKSWEAELNEALRLQAGHLSLYQLTVEPGTMFDRRARAGALPGLPSDDLGADFYDLTVAVCRSAELENYEVSNYAASEQESRHNLIYWNGGDYLGIGPGAHGRESRSDTRWATESERLPARWLEATQTGQAMTETALSLEDQRAEYLLMGLRLRTGIPAAPFRDLGGKTDGPGWDKMRDLELIEADETRIRATNAGRQLLNSVLTELEI